MTSAGPWLPHWCRLHCADEDPYPEIEHKTCLECRHVFKSGADIAHAAGRDEQHVTFCPFCLTPW